MRKKYIHYTLSSPSAICNDRDYFCNVYEDLGLLPVDSCTELNERQFLKAVKNSNWSEEDKQRIINEFK